MKKEKKTMYVHEIITIWSENGEVMIETCNGDIIVFNGERLFNDIPSLMTVALKERRNQEKISKLNDCCLKRTKESGENNSGINRIRIRGNEERKRISKIIE